jgi:hypothetical protein
MTFDCPGSIVALMCCASIEKLCGTVAVFLT